MQGERAFIASAFAAIAVSFGIGRYGIGLFLPDMARDFQLSEAQLGYLASAGWAGYVASSIVSMVVTKALGARTLVVSGLVTAAVGMALIAAAQSSHVLVAGAILTGVSPGLVFAPLADAVTALFTAQRRGPAFAKINAGEGAGAIAAGLFFLVVGGRDWRWAWTAFAILAIVAAAAVSMNIPRRSAVADLPQDLKPTWSTLIERRAWPLLSGAFVIGASTTVLWTYASVLVDGKTFAGLELRVVLWIIMGAAGVAAIAVAPILETYGLRRTYAASIVVTSVSAIALALAAEAPLAALVAGAIFGFAYIMITSQIGTWSLVLWPNMPAAGFGFTFLVFSAGAVAGPAAAGAATGTITLAAALAITGLITAGVLALLPGE